MRSCRLPTALRCAAPPSPSLVASRLSPLFADFGARPHPKQIPKRRQWARTRPRGQFLVCLVRTWQAENLSTAKPFQSTVPRDLNEQALWNRVLADPSAGRPLPHLSGDQRFAQSAGFTKMEASHRLPDGSSVSIHYQYKSVTGKAYDIKIVTLQPSVLQPGPSFTTKR